MLTDRDNRPGVQHQAITPLFDADRDTTDLREGARRTALTHVTISTMSMSGWDRDTTIGVSLSSLRVVLQTYSGQNVQSEYGTCVQSDAPKPAADRSLSLSRKSDEAGQTSFLQVLIAQRLHEQARLAYAQARARRYLDTARLFAARGGGWKR